MTDFETLAADVDADLAREDVAVNGVRLSVVTAGPADGDVVVLLHGFPEFWYSWRKQIPALADAGLRVIVPDMRGYNESEKPRGRDAYRIDRLVGDVAGLVDEFAESGTAHVVGHDWGGAVAWSVASRRADVVDRLAILNAPHPERFRELLRTPAQLKRSWYMFTFQLPRVPEWGLRRNGADAIGQLFADSMPPAETRHYREAFLQPGAATAAINYYRSFIREGARDELPLLSASTPIPDGRVDAPTLVCWGLDDEALVPANADGLDEWVPDLRVERIPDAGHWVQLDAADRVNDALLAHLDAA
ncbi:alpha/beta fold hydrolase [Halorubellus sp. PRR65]|uniref:alpha/beta fold hydrolase n=1 Tax=Halorubellus sp. PRR65 TaxID=3098148 RepID=UPI002B25B269|nr:alpha/beta fold hydrolase [Halorubellus sp. PRR65]